MSEQILATVGESKITKEDLDLVLKNAPQQNAAQMNTLAGKKYLLNEMITQEVLYLNAKEKGMDQEEEYLKELKAVQENLLKQYAIKKVLAGITVDENEVKEYYEKNEQQFVTGESAKALHILVKTEEEAKKIEEEINAGKSFEDAAKEYSQCPSKENGGDLGFFERGKMVPEFEEAAFTLEIGVVSEPVKTQFGYHLIKVVEKKESSVIPFEQVQYQIKDFVLRNKQNEEYKAYTDTIKEKYEITTNEDLLK